MKDLLSLLASKAGCIYISDLPTSFQEGLEKDWVSKISENSYTLKDWNETLNYLFREEIHCKTVTEAKNYLSEKLKK